MTLSDMLFLDIRNKQTGRARDSQFMRITGIACICIMEPTLVPTPFEDYSGYLLV